MTAPTSLQDLYNKNNVITTSTSPEAFGAKADGVTDDAQAINAALACGLPVILTPGKTYAHAGRINITTAGASLTGYNAILLGTNAATCGLHINANNVTIRGVYHTNNTGNTTRSSDNFNVAPFSVDYCSGTVLEDCVSEYSPAAGFFFSQATNFRSTRCVARYSLADAHHVTTASQNGVLVDAIAEYPGDDMFACVYYAADVGPTKNIRWLRPTGYGQANSGRGFSVVGAQYVTCDSPYIFGSYMSGIYIAAESGSFNTPAPQHVWVRGGEVIDCARSNNIGVELFNGVTNTTMLDCHVENVLVRDSYATQIKNNNNGAGGGTTGGIFSNCSVITTHEGSYIAGYYNYSEVGTSGGVTINVTAGGQWTDGIVKAHGARAYLSADYNNPANSASGDLALTTKGYDTENYMSGNGFKIPSGRAGLYLLTANVQSKSGATAGSVVDMIFKVNGNTLGESNTEQINGADTRPTAVFPALLNVGDTVSLAIYSTAAITLGSGLNTSMSLTYIGPTS